MRRGGGGGGSLDAVFYAKTYHPIQAGSIDGTDILPHDNAVYRASLCSNAGLYDPFGDLKATGDPYCTLFVARLSPLTTEVTLRKAMDQYGRVKNLRLVRHIVTGASRGYAFVEFETEKEMRRAYKDAHHTRIDDSEIIVDYNRQQLMPGWIPRRLGGGLGGKKESGQLRFGGRERPFRAPLKEIPFDDLKRLGIPPPPERYMSRFEIPSPPRRKRENAEADEHQELKRDRSPVRSSKHDEDPGDGIRGRRYADEGRQKKHDREWHRHEERRHSSSEKRRRRYDRYRDEDEEEEGHRRQQHYADSGRDDRWVPGGDDLY